MKPVGNVVIALLTFRSGLLSGLLVRLVKPVLEVPTREVGLRILTRSHEIVYWTPFARLSTIGTMSRTYDDPFGLQTVKFEGVYIH